MVAYLFNSTACLLAFYLFYRLLLERQSNHDFKRAYLLLSLVGGLLIPLISLPETVVTDGAAGTGANQALALWLLQPETPSGPGFVSLLSALLYGLGLLLFGYFFLRNLTRLLAKIRRHAREPRPGHTRVLLQTPEPPHTFFRYLFLNGPAYRSGKIPPCVIAHEEVHIRQGHSADLLLAETLCLLFWFNPLVYLYRQAIRLNHEFLADREVVRRGTALKEYQHTLLAFSRPVINQPAFIHAINYSSIKKRITVMKTNTPRSYSHRVYALLLPLLAGILYSFTSREVRYVSAADSTPVLSESGMRPELQAETPVSRIVPTVTRTLFKAVDQDGASRDEMKEYQKLAGKYNRMLEKGEGEMRIDKREVARLKEIYGRMSLKQRADAEPFPDFPPPPPAPEAVHPVPAIEPLPPHAAHPPHPTKPAHPVREVALPAPPPAGADALPAPPPPPDPVVHLKELARQGAQFYYEGKPVEAQAALKLFNSGKASRINVRDSGGGTEVFLSE